MPRAEANGLYVNDLPPLSFPRREPPSGIRGPHGVACCAPGKKKQLRSRTQTRPQLLLPVQEGRFILFQTLGRKISVEYSLQQLQTTVEAHTWRIAPENRATNPGRRAATRGREIFSQLVFLSKGAKKGENKTTIRIYD
jgi:hypothetical protein